MDVREEIKFQIERFLKGLRTFHPEEIPSILEEHQVIKCDKVEYTKDKLVLTYTDFVIKFNLIWKVLGPAHTLIGIEYDRTDFSR